MPRRVCSSCLRAHARLLLLLLALLLPLSAAAEGWTAKRLMVYDYTGVAWAPYTTAAIAYYRAHLPRRAPRLVHVPMTGPCQEHPGAIAICEWPAGQMANSGAWGETPLVRVNGTMRQAHRLRELFLRQPRVDA